jgi:pilus assembly protein Flp/PilA
MTVLKVRARSKIKGLISDEAGTVSLEYGLIASLVAVSLITGLSSLGNNLATSFMAAADAVLANGETEPPPAAERPYQ